VQKIRKQQYINMSLGIMDVQAQPGVPGTILVNGQEFHVGTGKEGKNIVSKLMALTPEDALENAKKMVILRLLKNSRYRNRFKNHEVNDDPLQRFFRPIIKVTTPMQLAECQKSMVKMMHWLVRSMCLNPENEEFVDASHEKFKTLLFKFRSLGECEEDFDPIFEVVISSLKKTEDRISVLQAGMGFSESEDSEPDDCNDEVMGALKNQRKQMQYTIAGLA
jgi:hypothetical protein